MVPFSSIRLSSMAEYFGTTVDSMEREIVNLLIDYRNSTDLYSSFDSNITHPLLIQSSKKLLIPTGTSPQSSYNISESPNEEKEETNVVPVQLDFDLLGPDLLNIVRIDSHLKIIHIGSISNEESSEDRAKSDILKKLLKEANEYCNWAKRMKLRSSLIQCKDLIVN